MFVFVSVAFSTGFGAVDKDVRAPVVSGKSAELLLPAETSTYMIAVAGREKRHCLGPAGSSW